MTQEFTWNVEYKKGKAVKIQMTKWIYWFCAYCLGNNWQTDAICTKCGHKRAEVRFPEPKPESDWSVKQ